MILKTFHQQFPGLERCDTTGFERRVRMDCQTVYDTVCDTIDEVKYRFLNQISELSLLGG